MQERSFTREAVLQALLSAKYDPHYAGTVVDAAWRELPTPSVSPSPAAAAPVALGGDAATATAVSALSQPSRPFSTELAEMPNSLETPDRAVEMLFVIE